MPFSNRKTRKIAKKKLLLLALLAGLLLIGGALTYTNRNNNLPVAETNPEGTEKIDLSPPTEEDKKAVDQHKDELGSQQTPTGSPTNTSQKKQVTPIITSASKSEIRAYVPGIVEVDGTCMATATQGSQVVTGSSAGFDNVSTTQCEPIPINLGSGSWSVIVTYSSPTAEGTSQAEEVK